MTASAEPARGVTRPPIPQASPGARLARVRPELLPVIEATLDRGRYVLGPEVAAFEAAFASYVGCRHCVGVGSGTDAITLALRALGIGEGDEVLTVSLTAAGTATGILRSGASVRFVDVEPLRRGLDPERLAAAVSSRTAAVVVVHLHGVPAMIEEIVAEAGRLGLPVVEDCAQAHGAREGGRMVGTFGSLAAFSFYPTKNLGGLGDGGAVVTDDAGLAARVAEAREYGWDRSRLVQGWGMNSRLDELQAAILRFFLPGLDAQNVERRRAAALYRECLGEQGVELPPLHDGAVYHQFAPAMPGRDAFSAQLAERGIGTGVHYATGLHEHPFYRHQGADLPVTSRLSAEMLSLPIQPEVFWPNADYLCTVVGELAGRWRA